MSIIKHIVKTPIEMGKCEKCGSNNGSGIYCESDECGCGALKHWSCKDCGHTTHYFHATKKGREILHSLLTEEKEG